MGSLLRLSYDLHPTPTPLCICCVTALCLWSWCGKQWKEDEGEVWAPGSHKGSLAGCLDTPYRTKQWRKQRDNGPLFLAVGGWSAWYRVTCYPSH